MIFDKIPVKNSLFPIAFCAFFLYNGCELCWEVMALAEVIGFVSGKGGMGKTALCAAVAAALAADGRRVLCIDCDDGRGDLDAYLGLGQLPDLTYPEVCRGAYPLERATAHHELPKLRFLAAPAQAAEVDGDPFSGLLRRARQNFDYILLDSPRDGLPADRWVLVTRPDPAAIRGARRKADTLELQGKANVRLIVNGIDAKQMAAMGVNVDDVMDQVGLPLLGIVPLDPAVPLACAKGSPLQGKKGAAAAARRIAQRLQGMNTAVPSRL